MKVRVILAHTKRDVLALSTVALAARLVCARKGAGGAASSDSRIYLTLAKSLAFHHAFSPDAGAETLRPTCPCGSSPVTACRWWQSRRPSAPCVCLKD